MSKSDQTLLDDFTKLLRDKASPTEAPDMFEGEQDQILAALAVYRNNVRSSLSRVLGDTFPVVKQLVGDEFFKFLAHEYYHAHPPTSRMVVRYGDQLPSFLEGFKPVENYPYLPDVARIEILHLQAYHAADAVLMRPDKIMAQAGDDIASLKFGFHPSLSLFSSDHAAASVWRAHQPATLQPMSSVHHGGEHAIIARIHNSVTIRVLTRGVYLALRALSLQHTLEEAVGIALDADEEFDPQSFFQVLFQLEIIIDIRA